jgi:uncharacterized protein (TIRG00374 family)
MTAGETPTAGRRWPRFRRAASGIARLALAAGAVAFLARGVVWADVLDSLHDANLPLLGVVVAINAAMMAVKAIRLDVLLGGRPRFWSCLLVKVTASAINNVAPLRSGDVARVWMLERQVGIPKPAAAAVGVVEMLLELAALAAIGLGAALRVPGQRWASGISPALLVGAVGGLFMLRRAGRRASASSATPSSATPAPPDESRTAPGGGGIRGRLRGLRARMAPGVAVLAHGRSTALAVALSFLAWGLEATMVLLCARAVHLPLGVPLALLVLLGINVALVFPSLPAGAGAFEAAVAVVLTLGGIAKGPAVAFAILYHLVQVLPVTVAGAWIILRVGVTLGGLPAALGGWGGSGG